MPRVLLLMPKDTYRAEDFIEGARRAGAEVRVGSDVCHVLHEHWATGALSLDFEQPEGAAGRVVEACLREPVDAILPVTDATALVAAMASDRLGLPYNAPEATAAARSKRVLRETLAGGDVRQPAFRIGSIDDDPHRLAGEVSRPAVLKPALLSASRGVIRADDETTFVQAFERIRRLLTSREMQGVRDPDARTVVAEQYVPGSEVALEGLLSEGRLHALALFDKPDPLEGPFFAESFYVTPSRLARETQEAIRDGAERACAAMGLRTGPVHAELRLSPEGEPVLIELAARSIGGLCGRALQFADGMSLEELIVRHAIGHPVAEPSAGGRASGVLMISPPEAGVLEAVRGIDEARAVSGVEDVVIGTPSGTKLVPPPEGGDYLGFVFARAATPGEVEQALREAEAKLSFDLARSLT